jgi:hypothetical protein
MLLAWSPDNVIRAWVSICVRGSVADDICMQA